MKQCFITGMTHFISEIFLNIVAYWQAERLSWKVMDLAHHSWKVKQRQLSKRPAWTLRGAAALVSEVNRVFGFEKHEGGKKKKKRNNTEGFPARKRCRCPSRGATSWDRVAPPIAVIEDLFFFFLLKVIRFGGRGWGGGPSGMSGHQTDSWFFVFSPLNSIKLDKIKTKGKTQCRQSINIQDGTTQLLYISSYKSDSRHIKAVFRQSGFFPLLSFSFFFLSPPPRLLQCKSAQLLCNLDNTQCIPDAGLFTHTGRRGELKSRWNPIKCLCAWCDESAGGVRRAFFKLLGDGGGIMLTPGRLSCMMGAACRRVFVISATLAFKGSGIIYIYHTRFFFSSSSFTALIMLLYRHPAATWHLDPQP